MPGCESRRRPQGAKSGHRMRAQVEAELGPGTDGLVWVLWQAKADFVLGPRLARAARHKLPFTSGEQLSRIDNEVKVFVLVDDLV
jgi:hypothetical protein